MFSTGNNSATLKMAAMAYSIISTKRKREFKDDLILETARAKTSCLQWCAAGGNPKQPADEEKKPLVKEEEINKVTTTGNCTKFSSPEKQVMFIIVRLFRT